MRRIVPCLLALCITSLIAPASQADSPVTRLRPPVIDRASATLEWNSAGELQTAPTPTGPWTTVEIPAIRQSTATVPLAGGHRFFRVVEHGRATAAMPLVGGDPARPFKIRAAFLRRLVTAQGNAVLEAELEPGQSPPDRFPILNESQVLVFQDDGEGGDARKGDGIFTAVLTVNEDEFAMADAFVKSLPVDFRVTGQLAGRDVVGGFLPTTLDLPAFQRGERIRVHPSPFDGTGVVPDHFQVPGPRPGPQSLAASRPLLIETICATNIVFNPVITFTNRLIKLDPTFATNIVCTPQTVGFRDRLQTNIHCEDVIVGFVEPRRLTNLVCVSVPLTTVIVDTTATVCVTNVSPNPLRLMTNIVCGDTLLADIKTMPDPQFCKAIVAFVPEQPEFITNVVCAPVTGGGSIPGGSTTVCATNLLVDVAAIPIWQTRCLTNVVTLPGAEPIIVETCVTNQVVIPGGEILTNLLVTNLVLVTNIACTNLVIGGGPTNVIDLPIDDYLKRPIFWPKSLLITDLSVVEDPLRTWDPCRPERGTKMGAWTFGRLMWDMCNPAVTGIDPSEFARRWLRSWEHNLSINFDTVTNRQAEILAQVIRDWEIASGGRGAPLDLSIAPFRLLAIVNRVDLRGNPGYGGTVDEDPCNPSCFGGEGRFVFGLVPALRQSGGGGGYGGGGPGVIQSSCDAAQFTVIFEYCVPKRSCGDIKQYALQWYGLSQIEFGSSFNAALQAITDQFAAAGADPTRKPNLSALNQLRANELLREPWDMREWRLFGNDSDAGWLREVTAKQTPDFDLNFSSRITEYALANAGPILAQEHVVPLQFRREPFLGGDAPIPTRNFFWDGPQPTGTIPGEIRHRFSLNTCSGCHAGETATPFTHVFPRAFGRPAALSDFLTGRNMPKLDPADGVTARFFSDLQRREDDLLKLIKEPCFFQIFHQPLRAQH